MQGLTSLNNFVISTGAYPHFLPRRIEQDHVCAYPRWASALVKLFNTAVSGNFKIRQTQMGF